MKYKAINYNNWDVTGKGKNILPFFEEAEIMLWNLALPFQDKRNDSGHAETVAYFAIKLLSILGGDRKVILPAAILHDVGWSRMSESEVKLFYAPNWEKYESSLRAKHQKEGVELARKILKKIGYPEETIPHVLEIISQHDTREGFHSLEDGIVRDADKLWRFTFPCLKLAMKERRWSIEEIKDRYNKWMKQEGLFSNNKSREIARIEEENTLNQYFSQS